MPQDKLKSALAGLPQSMQRPLPRPKAPGVRFEPPMSRPMPRPIPSVPGQNMPAAPGSKAPDFRGQPVFKPFPRPINPPGQRPDMFAGGTPNFNEMLGQYKPQPLPNVQDAFQQAYQQYNSQPMQQPMNEMQQQLQSSPSQSYQPNPNALVIGPGGQRMTMQQLQELQRQNPGQFKPIMG